MKTYFAERFNPWIVILAAVVLGMILLASLSPGVWATPAQKNVHQQTAPTIPPYTPGSPGEPEPPPPPGGSGGPGGGAPPLTLPGGATDSRQELTLTLTGDRELAVPGDRIVFVASVTNAGSAAVADAALVVSFPGVLAPGESTATQGTVIVDETNSVVADVGPLAPGQKVEITVEAVVAHEPGEDTVLEVQARLSLAGNVVQSATALIGLPPNELPPTARLGRFPRTLQG